MTSDLEFNYEDLRFIELQEGDSKFPKRKWGGYSQDFDDADTVYTHDEVLASQNTAWGVVDIDDMEHRSLSLLILDLDIHKAGDDFDADSLGVPADTPIVKSQNGGLHVYFAVHDDRGAGNESDFKMTADLGWDIDIRGSYVSHHVVAPADIPGVEGGYELVQDGTISMVFDPADAAERIRYNGEALLEYNPDTPISDFDYDRPSDPPEDMPTCYHAGLSLREANPDDHPNTHKVNVLTALCGLAAGYTPETVTDHFVNEYAPGPNADLGETEYQVKHLAKHMEAGRYSPPALSTLRDFGVLDEDEDCDCPIPYHGGEGKDLALACEEMWEWWSAARTDGQVTAESIIPDAALLHVAREHTAYDVEEFEEAVDEIEELPPSLHNKAIYWVNEFWPGTVGLDLEEDEDATARSYKGRDPELTFTWDDVRYIYEESMSQGRQAAENLLRRRYEFMTVTGTDTLHVYDDESGVYTGELSFIKGEIHDGLGEYWSTHELNEVEARLRQQNRVKPRHLNARSQFDDPHVCVKNGVLNLFTRELKPHSHEYYFVDRVPVAYDPDAPTEPYESFLDDVTRREEDEKAMMEMVGHTLIPDANERYKLFLILHGSADNGKSEFYRRIVDLLEGPDSEENNVANVKLAKLTSNRFSMDSMHGSMANIAGEIDGKKIRNTASLKDITGGDQIEIEPKGDKSFFDAINTTLMFAANDPPIIGERDKKAIASRIVPIELPYTFVDNPDGPMQKQRRPESELEEELSNHEALSGFLNLALDGIQRLEENNGDVSLPESPSERLENYEKQADSMKEFGHKCLENKDGDYVVKADITSIYKQFASENQYEIGSSVSSTLHGVLQGMGTLNYTTSRPRSPDYHDTSLPLRPWNDRKSVVSRVSLTEEGLEYADAAGLVLDEEEQEDGVTKSAINLTDQGPGMYQQLAIATIAEKLDAPDWLEGKGHFVDGAGSIMPYIVEGTDVLGDVDEADEVELRNVKIEDRDGVPTAVLSGITDVKKRTPSHSQKGLDNGPESGTAATDGGNTTVEQEEEPKSDDGEEDIADVRPRVACHLSEQPSGKKVKPASLAGELNEEPDAVRDALKRIKSQDSLLRADAKGFETL